MGFREGINLCFSSPSQQEPSLYFTVWLFSLIVFFFSPVGSHEFEKQHLRPVQMDIYLKHSSHYTDCRELARRHIQSRLGWAEKVLLVYIPVHHFSLQNQSSQEARAKLPSRSVSCGGFLHLCVPCLPRCHGLLQDKCSIQAWHLTFICGFR